MSRSAMMTERIVDIFCWKEERVGSKGQFVTHRPHLHRKNY